MLCRMPAVGLPDDLIKQLEQSDSGQIDNTEGPGVAVYSSTELSDEATRADIYVGIKLDGFKLYRNISSFNPSIKMQFALSPVVSCPSDVRTFKPDVDNTIAIQVVHVVYYCV